MSLDEKFFFLYLHGFKSGPESTKAQFIKDFSIKKGHDFLCPPLDISPENAIIQIQKSVDYMLSSQKKPIILGSSLGGFYATWLMQTFPDAKKIFTVLLNPSTKPSRDLITHIQYLKEWQKNTLKMNEFTEKDIEFLLKMETEIGTEIKHPENFFLVAAKGDEVLDWKEMTAFHKDCKHYLIEGSNHSLTNFPVHWSKIISFVSS